MKKIITAALLLSALSIVSCSLGGDDSMSNGTITGIDIRECACCGGFFIEIDNVTYRFYDVPANSESESAESYLSNLCKIRLG